MFILVAVEPAIKSTSTPPRARARAFEREESAKRSTTAGAGASD
jgi:hypothetical protein